MTNEVRAVETPLGATVFMESASDERAEFKWQLPEATDVWAEVAKERSAAILYGYTR